MTTAEEASTALAPWLANLIDRWDIDSLAARIVQRDMALAFREWQDDPGFSDMLLKSARSNLEVLCRHFAGEGSLDDVSLSHQVRFARQQAQLGSSQNALQRSYRLGVHTITSDWLALVADEAKERDLGAAETTAAMTESVEKIMRYADVVLTQVAEEFAEQEARLRRTGEQIRQQVIRDVVTGSGPVQTAELLTTLGYDVSGAHLAVEVIGLSLGSAQAVLRQLRLAGSSVHHLAMSRRVDHLTVWLYQPRSWREESVAAVAELLRSTGHTALLSRPAIGVDGLRETFREIREMESLGGLGGLLAPCVVSYADVQLDLLLLKDPDAAKRFVSDTLGELADDTATAGRLRETLLASFVSGSHVQAAEMLGLHEHTVRNRLQRAERILGESAARRRVELQTALRVHTILNPARSTSDSRGSD